MGIGPDVNGIRFDSLERQLKLYSDMHERRLRWIEQSIDNLRRAVEGVERKLDSRPIVVHVDREGRGRDEAPRGGS